MQYSLLSHYNNSYVNAPRCYVIRTLSVLFTAADSIGKMKDRIGRVHTVKAHVGGQFELHSLVVRFALCPSCHPTKERAVTTEQETGWVSEPLLTAWRKEKSLVSDTTLAKLFFANHVFRLYQRLLGATQESAYRIIFETSSIYTTWE